MEDDEKWASAAFMASSLTITPDEMASRIGLPPTRSHQIGDPYSPRATDTQRTDHLYAVHANEPDSAPLQDHIQSLLALLEPRAASIADLAAEAQLYLFCGFSSGNGQGGFTLTPETLTRIAALGLELSLDLYPPSEWPDT